MARTFDWEEAARLCEAGLSWAEAAKELGVSKAAVAGALKTVRPDGITVRPPVVEAPVPVRLSRDRCRYCDALLPASRAVWVNTCGAFPCELARRERDYPLNGRRGERRTWTADQIDAQRPDPQPAVRQRKASVGERLRTDKHYPQQTPRTPAPWVRRDPPPEKEPAVGRTPRPEAVEAARRVAAGDDRGQIADDLGISRDQVTVAWTTHGHKFRGQPVAAAPAPEAAPPADLDDRQFDGLDHQEIAKLRQDGFPATWLLHRQRDGRLHATDDHGDERAYRDLATLLRLRHWDTNDPDTVDPTTGDPVEAETMDAAVTPASDDTLSLDQRCDRLVDTLDRAHDERQAAASRDEIDLTDDELQDRLDAAEETAGAEGLPSPAPANDHAILPAEPPIQTTPSPDLDPPIPTRDEIEIAPHTTATATPAAWAIRMVEAARIAQLPPAAPTVSDERRRYTEILLNNLDAWEWHPGETATEDSFHRLCDRIENQLYHLDRPAA